MFARCLTLLSLTLTFASPALTQERVALLIGNQDYKPDVGRLKNPLNDIKLVGDALRKVGFDVLKPVKNATRADILNALDRYVARLRDAGKDAIGFVYYSGHGIASRGTNYLIPIDLEQPSTRLLRAYGVRQSEVLTLLHTEAPNAVHYVVIDACRNELQGARGGKGFVAISQQAGTLIAYATAPGRTATDRGKGGGPYAKALAAEIVKPDVPDLLMFHRVRVLVSDATGGDQVPWTVDGIRRKQRVLFGGRRLELARPRPPLSDAAQVWAVTQNSSSVSVLKAFERRFGDTVFGELARARIAELERETGGETEVPQRQRVKPDTQAAGLIATPTPSVSNLTADICKGAEVKLATGATICIWAGSGKSFNDCAVCPEMVVVPAGNFMMGSAGGRSAEKPIRRIRIDKPFAVGKFEVTFDEWDACVAEKGCAHRAGDMGWGRGKLPVIDVSWNDVTRQYLPWLSRRTGKSYRLLTEAEWEYVARAGTTTDYWWGNQASRKFANYGHEECCEGLAEGADKWANTSPVGSFKPNAFGLFDLHGNVAEWVQDCYRHNYVGAPTDGSAVRADNCKKRVLRGGFWYVGSAYIRSAYRHSVPPDLRIYFNGFRVARTLDP